MLPSAGDGHEIIGPAGEFDADVVDEEIGIAACANHASEDSACHQFARGKNDRLDALHPFAPARFRRQMLQLAVKQAAA